MNEKTEFFILLLYVGLVAVAAMYLDYHYGFIGR